MKVKELRRVVLVVGLILGFICNSANAVTLSNLYSVNLNVADNRAETRNKLLPDALEQVLVKVSSSTEILQNKELAVAKQQVDKYVNGFSYKQNEELYKLTIQFNEKMISQLLSRLGRPAISKNRPLVLLRLIDGGTHEDVVAKLDILSNRYGMPIVVPLLDLSEMHMDAKHVGEVASRYRADVVMTGKISHVSGEWHCEWQLFNSDKVVVWGSNGANLDSQLDLMVTHLAEQLTTRYNAVTVAKNVVGNKISLRVNGVTNINDYAKITAYLKNLAPIKRVEVKSVLNNEVVFLISAEGGKEAVTTAISLDRLLTASVDSDTDGLSYKVNL